MKTEQVNEILDLAIMEIEAMYKKNGIKGSNALTTIKLFRENHEASDDLEQKKSSQKEVSELKTEYAKTDEQIIKHLWNIEQKQRVLADVAIKNHISELCELVKVIASWNYLAVGEKPIN